MPRELSLWSVLLVSREVVKKVLELVDFNNSLGINTRWLSTPRPGSGGKVAVVNCLQDYIAARKRDPEAIICMRVGKGGMLCLLES
jgi:hypothetical protein